MRRTALSRLAALVAVSLAWPAAAQDRTDQAVANYRAVMAGSKQIGQLTPQELADLAELDRMRRAQKPDTRTLSQRCVDDEIRHAGGTVGTLQRRVIDMKCREAGD